MNYLYTIHINYNYCLHRTSTCRLLNKLANQKSYIFIYLDSEGPVLKTTNRDGQRWSVMVNDGQSLANIYYSVINHPYHYF